MKKNIILKSLAAMVLGVMLTSCEEFLNRPAEDNYNVDNFYQTDEQCEQGVNYLYNSPWYDFQRGFIKVSEVMSGNIFWGQSPYLEFTTNATDQDLINMSYSLWAVNGHVNTVVANLLRAEGPSDKARYKSIAEALTWKAFAYFYMVRIFGEVPIIHDNVDLIARGDYNKVQKVTRECVYEYIIMTLEKAMELFDKYGVKTTSGWKDYERIDYYCAEALLAKVYLSRAGLSGSLSEADLQMAAKLAKDVMDNSGRTLTPNYEDIFRLKNFNTNGECLISWLWKNTRNPWTAQNTLQSDLMMGGFDENGDCWGGWTGPSVDLAEAFGVSATDNPATRDNSDIRRHATIMMAGDTYDYFWTDKGGFDYLRFIYDSEGYGKGGPSGTLQCNTGTNMVKHLYGDNYDHYQAIGEYPAPEGMCYQLPTHLLRLSDVYLIYAEAKLGAGRATSSDADVINAFAAVRGRSVSGYTAPSSVSWEDIWKERRLELACEGDRWFDFVRRSYYEMDATIGELKAQKRSFWEGLNDVYKEYIGEDFDYSGTWDASAVTYNDLYDNPNVTASSFTLPFPVEDVVNNPNMATSAQAIVVDVRTEYPFDF